MPSALRVLYVDDDLDLLEVSTLFLEAEGDILLKTFTTAVEALEQLKTERYDAIVSDYDIPGMDGIQFLVEVRAHFEPVPFILFTGKGSEEISIQAFENGADFYIKKSGEPTTQFFDLRNRIKKAVDHRRTETQVFTLNRLYSALSATNKAILSIHDRLELLTDVCRIAVDIGGFRMAWVGLVNPGKHFIKPIASYGYVDGYLDMVAISTDDDFQGRGPTGTAYREKTYHVCNDVESDPNLSPWLEAALKRGYRSIAAFPFALHTKYPCVITYYSSGPEFFTDQIIRLLDEQSSDLSKAFINLENEEQRITIKQDLKNSEFQYRRLFETVQDAILILDGDTGEVTDANKFILDMLGYPLEDLIGKHLWELGFIKDKALTDRIITELKTNGYTRYEDIPLQRKDRQRIDIEFMGHAYLFGDKKIIQCNFSDITKRKKAEEQLKESEEKFRGIFDTINDGIHIHEVELDGKPGKFVEVNEAACRMLGFSHDEMMEHGPLDFVCGDHSRPLDEIIRELFTTGHSVFETEHRRKDGTSIPVEVNAKLINFKNNWVILSVVRDITERKRIQEALVESESFNRGLVENLPDYIAVYGMNGKLLYVNPASARTLGYDADTLIGTHVLSYIAEEYHETVIAKMTARKEGGDVSPYEIEMVTRNGPRRSVIVKATPIQYQNNPAILLLLIDITERKHAEEALQKSEEKFRQLFTQMPSAVAIYEADDGGNDFIFKDFNTAAEKIEGKKKEDLIGKRVSEVFPEVKDFGVFTVFQRVWRTGEPEFFPSAVDRDERDTGTWRDSWVYRLGGGEVIAIYNDITGRKMAEKALEQANRNLTLLTSITRHDILNQLTVLIGQLELLERKQPDPSFTTYFNKISHAASRIHAMIQFTKEYEQIGLHTPSWQDIRILVETATKQTPLGKVMVKNDLPNGTEVFADPLITKVFYNLMDNAARYGGKITTIRFSAKERDGNQVVVCEDDGNGVPEAEKEKIFEQKFGKNTGLGLFLSREILSITGITIAETGEPGKGARFEMTVPIDMWRSAERGE